MGKSYVYTSMVFSVSCAGEYLPIALHYALSGLLFNGDDGTAATSTWPEHLSILRAVFERFRRYGWVFNLKKCDSATPTRSHSGWSSHEWE